MAEVHPRISFEGIASIWLTLIGVGGAGALFVLPHPYADYVGWSLIGVAIIGAVLLTIYHVRLRGWLKWLSLSRSAFAALVIGGTAIVLWLDYLYYTNYSVNGGIWHIRIGLQPTPRPTTPNKPEPTTPTPWVSQEEIVSQQQQGHVLTIHSPQEILEMWRTGKNIGAYLNKWIKVDYELMELTLETTDKKQIYITKLYAGYGFVFARFEPKKWETHLMQLRTGDRVKAICQLDRIDRDTSQKFWVIDNMTVDHCDFL